MPAVLRFYSPEWVAEFNRAVSGLALDGAPVLEASLVAADREVRVAQVVREVPGAGGPVTVTLVVSGNRLRLERREGDRPAAAPAPGEAAPGSTPATPPETAGAEEPDVTVSLSYADAARLSRGELTPAEAVASGRVRVRGDLSVLVAAQGLLAQAAARLGHLAADTLYE